MSEPSASGARVFADFNNVDRRGRVRLNTLGTQRDLDVQGIELKDGISLILDDDDETRSSGTVRWDEEEGWVAEVDWSAL